MKLYHSLYQVQTALEKGVISCRQLVEQYLHRIEEHRQLNAFVHLWGEEACARAEELDSKLRNGERLGKLFGMIIGIKDNLCYRNHKVTAASKMLTGFQSLFSATAIERLLEEDAIIIGSLNCDEFAMGSTNETSVYGSVLNPTDQTKVAGGSSGGCASAVGAHLCLAAIGSDTGGSVRQPAAFCGVVGLKPTYGRISRHGLIAYASSFDQIGILTNTVEDAALLLEVMAGVDDFDSTVSELPVPSYSDFSEEKKHYSIAYFKDAIDHAGLDTEIKQCTLSLLKSLPAQGHSVEAVEFPLLEHSMPSYYVLTTAEASSNLSRYSGMHFGYRSSEGQNLEDTYVKSRTQGFGKEVKRRIMLGTFVLSSGYYDAYFSQAQKVRRMIQVALEDLLDAHDFVIIPTTPSTAYKLGALSQQDPVAMFLADIYTVMANLAGIPAISLPLHTHSNGLPIGIQIMSKKFSEEKLLDFSRQLMNQKLN